MFFYKNFVYISLLLRAISVECNEVIDNDHLLNETEAETEYDDLKPNCLYGCPRHLDPICAVDELHPQEYKYFQNQCLMENDNCRQSRAWKPTQMLLCIKDIDPLVRDDCMRACPLIYNPVCASDGKNYEIFGNRCTFGIENCLASGKWLEVRAEQCGL
ncbi:U-Kazal-Dg21.2-like [Cochliomyia hominivorax]